MGEVTTTPVEIKAEAGDVVISAPTGRILLNVNGKLVPLMQPLEERITRLEQLLHLT